MNLGRALTMIVPRMNGWIRHWKWYTPGILKSILRDAGSGVPESRSSTPVLAKPLPCEAGVSTIELGELG